MIYTGIGSRETTEEILNEFRLIGIAMAAKGYTLRSGGALGADTAFEEGCDTVNGAKEIYLPWRGFNGNKSELWTLPPAAYWIAEGIHPAWGNCSQAARNFHARNTQQVLGKFLDKPTEAVVYWAQIDNRWEPRGGTRTAVMLARERSIPTYNFLIDKSREAFLRKYDINLKEERAEFSVHEFPPHWL